MRHSYTTTTVVSEPGRFLFVLFSTILLSACGYTSGTEVRDPNFPRDITPNMQVVVPHPVNRTMEGEHSFASGTGSTGEEYLGHYADRFPQADEQFQHHLVQILSGSTSAEERESRNVYIPFRHLDSYLRRAPEAISHPAVIEPNTIPEQMKEQISPLTPDLLVTARIEKGMIATGEKAEEKTNHVFPAETLVVQATVYWKIHDGQTGEVLRQERVTDQEFINIEEVSVGQESIIQKAFDQLLRRMAWSVVTHMVSHRYIPLPSDRGERSDDEGMRPQRFWESD